MHTLNDVRLFVWLIGFCRKCQARIGHFVEAQILEAIEVDYIDESEVLTMADEDNHINKRKFTVPFVCGCRNLGEALVSCTGSTYHCGRKYKGRSVFILISKCSLYYRPQW